MSELTVQFYQDRLASSPRELDAIGKVKWPEIEEKHKKTVSEYIKPSDKVLDVGCGIGRTAEWFKNYVGVDFVPEFIDIARKNHPFKPFLVVDITKGLPFQDKEFDWAVLFSVRNVIGLNAGWDVWRKVEKEIQRVSLNYLSYEYSDNDPIIWNG